VAVNVFLASTTWFSTISMWGAKSRPTTLLESCSKMLPQVNCHVLFYCTDEVYYSKC